MEKFLIANKQLIVFVFVSFILWFWMLSFFQRIDSMVPIHTGFINKVTPWANFDATHYISIGKINYVWQEQAFFPFYPMLIHIAGVYLFRQSYVPAGFFVNLMSLIIMLFMFGKLVLLDFPKKTAFWAIIFLLVFPTGFFLRAAYTESLFLLLTFLTFYFARKKQFILASVFAACASATRIVGIFLLPALLIEYFVSNGWKINKSFFSLSSLISIIILAPAGLVSYMGYLWVKYNDPILFFHNLSIYGEQRSANKIILLPQVLFRYFKILTTVSVSTYNFRVALLELSVFLLVSAVIILFWRKIRLSYLIYSIGALLLPTLSGSLSSFPRYALVLFPVFVIFAESRNVALKVILCIIFFSLEAVLSILFLRGNFIS